MKNLKKFAALGLSAAMALSLAACGSGGKETTADGTAQTTNGEVDKSQKLIVYTNSGSNGRDAWLKEQAAAAGYNIEVVQIQGGDLANRIIAEKNNPQADMVFGLNSIEYEKLKKENVLDQWEPSWVGDVDMSLGDKDGYYYPIVIQPLVNIMSADLQNPPKDYTDLVNPEWKDKYNILNFGGGTGKTILASLLIRFRDDSGEYGISDKGWEFVKNWIQNGHMEQQGEDYVGNVISGSIPITEIWGSGVLQNQTERNYKFQIMVPEAGVPYVTEQIAMIKGSRKKDLTVDFADWFGSAETQTAWMKQFGTIPCQPKALEEAPADIKEFIDLVHPQDMDWGFVAENIDQWVEKCELEFLQ
ncbi:extracellular solute-binding protein [Lacrimispora indolis]|uniref:extracellular solute-binding protein n=1 Tax=Lacrimispora indolis TaxID=69825 RepID=UPI0003F4E6BB|nr:extracellular solute-binding protein [[Clostridium] methoxybenzovorans]